MMNVNLLALDESDRDQFPGGMFRFEKVMK